MLVHRKALQLFSVFAAVVLCAVLLTVRANAQSDSLPSWNDGPAKTAIMEFVRRTTDPTGAEFVPEKDRIATFDQDGTLWTEHPLYPQAMFALERLGKMAPEHPDWKQKESFKTPSAVIPACVTAIISSQSDSVNLPIASRSPLSTAGVEKMSQDVPWSAMTVELRTVAYRHKVILSDSVNNDIYWGDIYVGNRCDISVSEGC